MTTAEWALVDRACVFARTTPRALLLLAAGATLQRETAVAEQRRAEQPELFACERRVATAPAPAAETTQPQIALPLAARRR